MCKQAVASGSVAINMGFTPRLEAPKPKEIDGKRDAKELDNYIWHLERYFEALNLNDEMAKVRTTSLYLTKLAGIWWRHKHAEIEKGTCTITSWEEFKNELMRQFYPENVAHEARLKMRELKHTRSIQNYVQEFSGLMLQISNMSDDNLLFNFTAGGVKHLRLHSWLRKTKAMTHGTDRSEFFGFNLKYSDNRTRQQRKDAKELLAGQIARAATIFRIEEYLNLGVRVPVAMGTNRNLDAGQCLLCILQVESSISAPTDGRNISGLTMASKNPPIWSGIYPNFAPNYESAVDTALADSECYGLASLDVRMSCFVSKALVNVGGELAKLVPGRVSTEVDARLAYDTQNIDLVYGGGNVGLMGLISQAVYDGGHLFC
ncbi:hypothetical protein CsSME_00016138 [Camellia sinensis var. sinensis]